MKGKRIQESAQKVQCYFVYGIFGGANKTIGPIGETLSTLTQYYPNLPTFGINPHWSFRDLFPHEGTNMSLFLMKA